MNVAFHDDLPNDFRILRTLGQGGEGAVYLVADGNSTQQYVLKAFHAPLPKAWAVGLRVYANQLSANDQGLLPIKLWENSETILGVYYPFTRLTTVHRRLVSASEKIAQAMVGSYCRMQCYLMSRHDIGLLEPSADHLMLAQDGRFCYVDFGYGISKLDNQEARRLNLFGYGLAAFLPSLYGQNLRTLQPPFEGHSYDQPCVYFDNPLLDKIAAQHKWLAPIIAKVRSTPASLLLDAEFYDSLSTGLPGQPPSPQLVIGFSRWFYTLGGLKVKARGVVAR